MRNSCWMLVAALVCTGLTAHGQTSSSVVQPTPTDPAYAAVATRGMVATVNPLATGAGLRAMAEGGNAVDAAIAAALMLGVVDCHNSGLGGGCFILIRRANGEIVAIDGHRP